MVDAYTGQVTFYVVDDEDPILRAWRSAFPDLFTPFSEMPDELADHLRYPEDLFRVQTDVYSKYRIDPGAVLPARWQRMVGRSSTGVVADFQHRQ